MSASMITSARIENTPPFTKLVEFELDEHVNLFIGPNGSGKSTILRKLAEQAQDDTFSFDFEGKRYPEIRPETPRREARAIRVKQEEYREASLQYALRMPWIVIPSVRLSMPFSDRISELSDERDAMPQTGLSEILNRQEVRDVFDGKVIYHASSSGDAIGGGMEKAIDLADKCAQEICRDLLVENATRDWSDGGARDHYDMGIVTIDEKSQTGEAGKTVFFGNLSSGTQGTLLWIRLLALRMADFYGFEESWEDKPAVLLVDEIENHLHPAWQRRVIPALRKHFPCLQIFATTHSPFVVAGLKAGQVHLLNRDESGVVSGSTYERNIVGWTIEEVLHSVMDVNALTDDETADKAGRLQELRRKDALEGLSDDEAAEMESLRAEVSRDMLASKAMSEHQNSYADMMRQLMESRLSETDQDNAAAEDDSAIDIDPNDAAAYSDGGDAYAETGEQDGETADYGGSARIENIPPFTNLVEFELDESVNLFIGPNGSGKSTILRRLAARTQDDDFSFGFEGERYPEIRPETPRREAREIREEQEKYREASRQYAQRMPWIFVPSVRLSMPPSDRISELLGERDALPQSGLSEIMDRQEVRDVRDVFDGKIIYHASSDMGRQGSGDEGIDNAIDLADKCAQDICRDLLVENATRDWSGGGAHAHNDMGMVTIDGKGQAGVFLGDLSSGTQGTLLWIRLLALRMADFHAFADGWEDKPAVLLVDEIENHLHPAWQRRVIPALRKHFPCLRIFATTHSPFVVTGLKAGQVHLLNRDESGVVFGSTYERDIVGWTIEEVLHSVMDVKALTDEETANKAARLQELQRKDALSDDEAAEMEDLRAEVSHDILAGGALNAQRERYDDMMRQFLQSRLAEAAQENAMADFDRAIEIDPDNAWAYNDRGRAHAEIGEYAKAIADYDRAIAIDPNNAMAYHNRGYAYSEMGERDKAIADYDRAIAIDPNNARAYNNRGSAYDEMGERDKAIADYDRAIALDPNSAAPYSNRGSAYSEMGEIDKAIADLDRAIALDPNSAAAYSNRGLAYYEMGERDKAIADYDRAIALDPNYAAAYNNRGYAYREMGEYDKAIADYDRAIALDSNDAWAYNNRGSAYYEMGERDKAIADYDHAIAFDPNYARAYNNRASAYREMGERDKAIADLDRAIALDPNNAMAYHNRGSAYYEMGERDKAIADYDRAIALDPNYAAPYNNRGYAYREMGEYDKAIADYDRAIALDPNYAMAYHNRGSAYGAMGERDKAIADYDRAIALDPNYALAYNNRGSAYSEMGEIDKAIADYDRAIALDPNNALAYNNRGSAYSEMGEIDKAIADLDRAIALDPNNAAAYSNRGYAYGEIGERAKAIADYDRAIALDPNNARAYNNRGSAYGEMGERAKAIADYDRAIALDPNYVAAYNNRGVAYAEMGEYAKALADLNRAIALDLNLALAYRSRAHVHRALGDSIHESLDMTKYRALGGESNPPPL